MEKIYRCSSSGFNFGSVTFLICVRNLPRIIDNDAKVVLFTDYTSIIVTNSNQGGVKTALN